MKAKVVTVNNFDAERISGKNAVTCANRVDYGTAFLINEIDATR